MCCVRIPMLCTGDTCDKVHGSMPYQWQIWSNNEWRRLPNYVNIEKDYCNPATTQHDGSPPVDFHTMTCGSADVRRISVGLCNLSAIYSLSCLATKWVWYREESENIWREFTSPSSSMTSEELERRRLNNETDVIFAAGDRLYDLNFQDMIQTNVITRTQRLVRRRPLFISKKQVQKACDKYCSSDPPNIPSSLPDYWDRNLLPAEGYERIRLNTASLEYATVLSLFNRTMAGCNILSIDRIQNVVLWTFFSVQRDNMKTRAKKDIDGKLLFHGTSSKYVDAICRDNIDWRVCGKNGTHYGQGSYFARDAKYSDEFTDRSGTKSMFVCRILVGDFTLGNPEDRRPPIKNQKQNIAFDSCVNDVQNPTKFVIFEKSQIYPEYLIQYKGQPPAASPLVRQAQPRQVQPRQAQPSQAQPVQAQPLQDQLSTATGPLQAISRGMPCVCVHRLQAISRGMPCVCVHRLQAISRGMPCVCVHRLQAISRGMPCVCVHRLQTISRGMPCVCVHRLQAISRGMPCVCVHRLQAISRCMPCVCVHRLQAISRGMPCVCVCVHRLQAISRGMPCVCVHRRNLHLLSMRFACGIQQQVQTKSL
ncbi:hypothetical protein ACEWY4_027789 [Coilia grayii]|uniref:Poly [ADP-ribose] polymerase n=1 Tax=Coilia grayii TaxID=363190 RepID=A0ABD1IP75_9TELE